MDRMIQANVIAISGRAVEAAGDVDVLLLDRLLAQVLATDEFDSDSVHVFGYSQGGFMAFRYGAKSWNKERLRP